MPDFGTFKRICYLFARRIGGSVREIRLAQGPTPNFHYGAISYGDRSIAVVQVRDAVLFALAIPRPDDAGGARDTAPLVFVDEPDLAATLAEVSDAQVLAQADLDASFDIAHWPDIHPSDAAYWQPTTVGEALFNYWD